MDHEESSGSNKRRLARRREKHGHPAQEKQNHVLESADEEDGSPTPPRPSSHKGKTKGIRRRRESSSSDSMEEDIIDGFSIRGFKTLDDLEVSTGSRFPSLVHSSSVCTLSAIDCNPFQHTHHHQPVPLLSTHTHRHKEANVTP